MPLYLDDLRPTPEGFDRVYSYEEFVDYLCAKYLVDYCLAHQRPLPNYQVHSQNPVGKENIERLLENFKKFEF